MMTKQEEIREGIARRIAPPHQASQQQIYLDQAVLIMRYLHSQGCVLKVDRELPEPLISGGTMDDDNGGDLKAGAVWMRDTMLKAGYVAVEPLIGGDNEQGNKETT